MLLDCRRGRRRGPHGPGVEPKDAHQVPDPDDQHRPLRGAAVAEDGVQQLPEHVATGRVMGQESADVECDPGADPNHVHLDQLVHRVRDQPCGHEDQPQAGPGEEGAQVEDVRAARRDLHRLIEEVDQRIAELFDQAFRDVSREFEALFAELFPGGEGRLTLLDRVALCFNYCNDYGVTCAPDNAPCNASSSFKTARSLVDSSAFAPSDLASLGLSCTSMNTPSTPAATAARASTGMNSG